MTAMTEEQAGQMTGALVMLGKFLNFLVFKSCQFISWLVFSF